MWTKKGLLGNSKIETCYWEILRSENATCKVIGEMLSIKIVGKRLSYFWGKYDFTARRFFEMYVHEFCATDFYICTGSMQNKSAIVIVLGSP